ncbi:hypothetical protein VTI74DRAFT_9727 [Chaetomium olivicolor]
MICARWPASHRTAIPEGGSSKRHPSRYGKHGRRNATTASLNHLFPARESHFSLPMGCCLSRGGKPGYIV